MANKPDTSPAPPGSQPPPRWAKHAVWLGVVITVAGFLSYFTFAARFPALRDVPWLNLPVVLLGVLLTVFGGWQVFRSRGRVVAKCLSALAMLITLFVAAVFNLYVFSWSYQLPDAAQAAAEGATAPEVTLPDHRGQSVSLSDYRGRKLLIVFYRGHW